MASTVYETDNCDGDVKRGSKITPSRDESTLLGFSVNRFKVTITRSNPFVFDTSPKSIDHECLGELQENPAPNLTDIKRSLF